MIATQTKIQWQKYNNGLAPDEGPGRFAGGVERGPRS